MSRSARSTIRAIASGRERLEDDDLAAREQRAVQLEGGVLGRRADEHDVAGLDVRQEHVLLRAVEPVDLVEKEDRALAVRAAQPPGLLEDLAHLLHAGRDRRVRQEERGRSAPRSAAPASSCRRPAGPRGSSDGTRSSAIARRRKPLAPTTSSGPSTSSSERGRIRSASGVDGREAAVPRRGAAGRSSASKRSPLTRRPRGGRRHSSEQTGDGLAAAPAGSGEPRGRSRSRRRGRAPSPPSRAAGRAAPRAPGGRRTAARKIRRPRSTVRKRKSSEDERGRGGPSGCPRGGSRSAPGSGRAAGSRDSAA